MRRLGVLVRWPGYLLVLALCWPSAVEAQDSYYEPEPVRDSYVTLSISPLHLLVPMVELQAEVRLGDLFGLAAIGGIGRVSAKDANGQTLHFRAWEVGGQFVWYPSVAFKELQLGVEGLLMHVAIEDVIGNARVSGLGAGFSTGPFIGYKWISEIGFSVFLQGGFSLVLVRAKATNDLGQSATKNENEILMLLNVNLGWSF